MNKFIIILLSVSIAMAGGVRVASLGADGVPEEEIIDLSICLERTPTSAQEANYEDVIRYYADALYEMSNGGNYLGNVDIYTGERYCSSVDVVWNIANETPRANPAGFMSIGNIIVSDDWGLNNEVQRLNFGMTLAHESGHYLYGLWDDYTETVLPRSGMSVTADPVTDRIIVTNVGLALGTTEFQDRVSPFEEETPIIFYPVENVPHGLETFLDYPPDYTYPGGVGLYLNDYATIEHFYWDSPTSYSFTLKDRNKNHIDIKSAGSGVWYFDLPGWNRSRVAHSIMDNQ